MSDRYSAASAGSTSDSHGQDTATSSSANPTRTGGMSSPPAGPESPSTMTCALSLSENQRGELLLTDQAHQLTAGGGKPGQGYQAVLISSAEGSPAKTYPSPDDEPGSTATAPASSSSSPGSLSLFDPDGYSSRTYPGSSPRTAVGTSESCLERWPTSGMAWHGGLSTAASSECRSADGECSSSEPSLTEIVEPPQNVPAKYSLSAKAAAGILRRAEKRGRTLPQHLENALVRVASLEPSGGGSGERGWAQDTERMTFVPTLSQSLMSHGGNDKHDPSLQTYVSHSLTSEGHDAREDGTGRGTPIVAAPLTKGSATGAGVNAPGRRQEDDVNLVAFHPTGGGAKGLSESEDVAPGTGTGTVTIAATITSSYGTKWNGNSGAFSGENFAPPSGVGVRRLTPTECERLQSFPDGWTQLGGTPDSKRYSALGDAVTVSVAEWIGTRLATEQETK